jgi:hypothetical protein
MRFPSLIRLQKNKRFTIEPRYYDPIKEEIEERTRKIRAEMESEQKSADSEYRPARIRFERKTESAPSSSLIQLIIAAVLGGGVMGWLYFGNTIFYALWLGVPAYVFYRLKSFRRK